MACESDYSVEYKERMLRFEDAKTRLACDRCKEIEARGGVVPDWALEWWTYHQEHDAKRLLRSALAAKEAEIRKQAIAKLTPEERAELGV